jgi:hypothetical protein
MDKTEMGKGRFYGQANMNKVIILWIHKDGNQFFKNASAPWC